MESLWTKQYEKINYETDRGNIEDWEVYTGETPSIYTGPKVGFQIDAHGRRYLDYHIESAT